MNKIISNIYQCNITGGEICPSDDVSELKWFNIFEISQNWFDSENNVTGPIVQEHKPILKLFFEKYEN